MILNRTDVAARFLQWSRAGAIALLLAGLVPAGCSDTQQGETQSAQNAPSIPRGRIEASLDAAADYLRGGHFTEAEAILTRLLDRAPDEVDAHELYAQLLLNRAAEAREQGVAGRERELTRRAYEHYRRMTELLPHEAGAQQSAGEMAHAAGLIDEAIAHYRRADELDATNPRYAVFAAQILLEREAHQEAERMLSRALRIDPDEPMVHATLASLHAKRNEWNEAIASVRTAREIAPRDISYRVLEASLHRRRGEPRQGVQLLVHLSDQQRVMPHVASELAWCYGALGEHEQAGRIWAGLFDADPAGPNASQFALRAAESMMHAGQTDRAWRWVQEARRTGATDEEIRAVESMLRDRGE